MKFQGMMLSPVTFVEIMNSPGLNPSVSKEMDKSAGTITETISAEVSP